MTFLKCIVKQKQYDQIAVRYKHLHIEKFDNGIHEDDWAINTQKIEQANSRLAVVNL